MATEQQQPHREQEDRAYHSALQPVAAPGSKKGSAPAQTGVQLVGAAPYGLLVSETPQADGKPQEPEADSEPAAPEAPQVKDKPPEPKADAEPTAPESPQIKDKPQEPTVDTEPTAPEAPQQVKDKQQEQTADAEPAATEALLVDDKPQEPAADTEPTAPEAPQIKDKPQEPAADTRPAAPETPQVDDKPQEPTVDTDPAAPEAQQVDGKQQEPAADAEPTAPKVPQADGKPQEPAADTRPAAPEVPQADDKQQEPTADADLSAAALSVAGESGLPSGDSATPQTQLATETTAALAAYRNPRNPVGEMLVAALTPDIEIGMATVETQSTKAVADSVLALQDAATAALQPKIGPMVAPATPKVRPIASVPVSQLQTVVRGAQAARQGGGFSAEALAAQAANQATAMGASGDVVPTAQPGEADLAIVASEAMRPLTALGNESAEPFWTDLVEDGQDALMTVAAKTDATAKDLAARKTAGSSSLKKGARAGLEGVGQTVGQTVSNLANRLDRFDGEADTLGSQLATRADAQTQAGAGAIGQGAQSAQQTMTAVAATHRAGLSAARAAASEAMGALQSAKVRPSRPESDDVSAGPQPAAGQHSDNAATSPPAQAALPQDVPERRRSLKPPPVTDASGAQVHGIGPLEQRRATVRQPVAVADRQASTADPKTATPIATTDRLTEPKVEQTQETTAPRASDADLSELRSRMAGVREPVPGRAASDSEAALPATETQPAQDVELPALADADPVPEAPGPSPWQNRKPLPTEGSLLPEMPATLLTTAEIPTEPLPLQEAPLHSAPQALDLANLKQLPGLSAGLGDFQKKLHQHSVQSAQSAGATLKKGIQEQDDAVTTQAQTLQDGLVDDFQQKQETVSAQVDDQFSEVSDETDAAHDTAGADAHKQLGTVNRNGHAHKKALKSAAMSQALKLRRKAHCNRTALDRRKAQVAAANLHHGQTTKSGAHGKAKAQNTKSEMTVEQLRAKLQATRNTEGERLAEVRDTARKDLDLKLRSQVGQIRTKASEQEAQLNAEIMSRDAQIKSLIADKEKTFQAQVDQDRQALETTTDTEKGHVASAAKEQCERIVSEADKQAESVRQEGQAQAETAKKTAEAEAKAALATGEERAKEAITAADARAAQRTDEDEKASIRAQGQARAATARWQAAQRGAEIQAQGDALCQQIRTKAANDASKMLSDAQQQAKDIGDKEAAATKELDQKLCDAQADLQKRSADGIAQLQQDREMMLAELRRYQADSKATIEKTLVDAEADMDLEKQKALAEIDACFEKASADIDEKIRIGLDQIEAGKIRGIKALERMVEKTCKEVDQTIDRTEKKLTQAVQKAAKTIEAETNRCIQKVEQQGKAAVAGVDSYVQAAQKQIETHAEATQQEIENQAVAMHDAILADAQQVQDELVKQGDTAVAQVRRQAADAKQDLAVRAQQGMQELTALQKRLGAEIDDRWVADAVAQASEALDDSGLFNIVTDSEGIDAMNRLSGLPERLQGKAIEQMSDERFQTLLSEVPDERKGDLKILYQNMRGTDWSKAILKNFGDWAGDDKFLSRKEIIARMKDAGVVGDDAAALSTLRGKLDSLEELSNDEWGDENNGLTLEDLAYYAKMHPRLKDEDLKEIENSFGYSKQILAQKQKQDLFTDPSHEVDWQSIQQTFIGDCYFLAALTGKIKNDPSYADKIIKPNDDGSYVVTFPGKPPVTVSALTDAERAATSYSKDGLWIAVLEKAYGERREDEDADQDPYRAISGDSLHRGINDVTGSTTDADLTFFTTTGTTHKKLQSALDNDKIVTVSIHSENKYGLPTGHAYSVVGYDPESKTVTIRNPWGSGEKKDSNNHAIDGTDDGIFTLTLDELDDICREVTYEQ